MDHSLRLRTQPRHGNLYSWAINEVAFDGTVSSRDQIPWAWNLNFTATSCVVVDAAEKDPWTPTDAEKPSPTTRRIVLALRPGSKADDGDVLRQTRYSIFGTDRIVKDFTATIEEGNSGEVDCHGWAVASYTYENDFRTRTAPDCMGFRISVPRETFGRYCAMIIDGGVDDIVLGVRSVSGFYSDWSPSISTTSIKVLGTGEEWPVEGASEAGIDPPRMGEVYGASLRFSRRLDFPAAGGANDREAVNVQASAKPAPGVLNAPIAAPAALSPFGTAALGSLDPRVLSAVQSLKMAAWLIVGLVGAVVVKGWTAH